MNDEEAFRKLFQKFIEEKRLDSIDADELLKKILEILKKFSKL